MSIFNDHLMIQLNPPAPIFLLNPTTPTLLLPIWSNVEPRSYDPTWKELRKKVAQTAWAFTNWACMERVKHMHMYKKENIRKQKFNYHRAH